MATLIEETVTHVHHWTDRLFSFRTTRDRSFRFENGQLTLIGMEVDGRPLMRAYSIASANYEDELEFFSIIVPNGPLTSRLKSIEVGDTLLVSMKTTGTLVTSSLLPGKHLYLIGTGTGLAPFLSVARDPFVYEKFDKIIVVHGCRNVADLAYRDLLEKQLFEHEILGDIVRDKLLYYPTVTREPFKHEGRVTTLMETGKLCDDLGLPPFNVKDDRFMLCGSLDMLKDCGQILDERGFSESRRGVMAEYVIERAFVET